MFNGWLLFLVITGYLTVLFIAAYFAESREKKGRSIVTNPYVYSLSMAVYCTSWTFYGSVGNAATSGLSFLTTYLGPTLMACLWPLILTKVIRIAKENRITTISDFIGSRYGNSIFLSALVTVVAVVGIAPYMGLQLKAITSTFAILAGETRGSGAAGWFITLILGIFAIIFGARRLDSSERHEGLIFAIAFESIVKLAAFLAVGLYVTFGLFHGFPDIFSKLKAAGMGNLLTIGGAGAPVSFSEWGSLLFLSMMAIMFLPRQFQVAVVENSDEKHVSKAMWLFPLYLFLINIFVMPVAFGGLLLGGHPHGADNFVLTIPLDQGRGLLALLAFIGGFSAATGMVIVESLAISTMVMNNLVMPAIYKFHEFKRFPVLIINIKRVLILGCVFLGYFAAASIGAFNSLVDMGLKSFEAVSIFAPAFILGLYWKRGNKNGAIAGIIGGFAVWLYTLLIPAMVLAGVLPGKMFLYSVLANSRLLNPHALFGLEGLDRWTNSLFWSMLVNLLLYAGFSIFTGRDPGEERQALMFVESYSPRISAGAGRYGVTEVKDLLGQYIGRREARDIVEHFMARNGIASDSVSRADLIRLKEEAKRVLSGVLGSSIATIVFEDKLTQTEEERGELLSSIKQMTYTLRLSRRELEEANRQLGFLKEFSENIIESIPLGVATFDETLRVRYWNRAMEKISGEPKDGALDQKINLLLECMEPDLFSPRVLEGEVNCRMPSLVLKGYQSRFTGSQKGYFVLVLEDVTEKRKIEEELFRASKHAGIGRLAAGVAHEIGNPLASISSLVQELMGEGGSGFMGESLSTINRHVDRIARIVRNLGDFARLYPRQRVQADLGNILGNTINLVRYDKNFRDIEITTEIGPGVELKIDPDQLQQVFLNLILNARDAMPGGGRLSISIKRRDGAVDMVFSDTGEGMGPETKEKIFDAFFSTKAPSRGTGLGLSICYSIIKDHGGTIETVSEKGKGASFIIKLPLE